ncbi:MAG: acetyl-CoA carboxylase biotin carboxylase subunit [bacterium]
MFEKVLVANRGEIAIRIFRALIEMGIRSVAVYSEADRLSSHLRYADEAYLIGPAPASESYLCIDKIIDVAKRSKAQAIHPGYGFLAESYEFAKACEENGIVFIGPQSQSIYAMGIKTEAKRIMRQANVPVIPGPEEPIRDIEEASKVANKIGYPIMLKASGGGGGQGMRVVTKPDDLPQAFRTAKSEAEAYFGNPDMFIEKCIEKPRHIEVQIIADNYGNVIHLGERECSIQRRYQKLIEESPSPAITPSQRSKIGETAVRAARAADYRNAGTVEFIMDKDGNFYFLEMNTRLQVEHPVTEFVTGIDIVATQIRLACGEKLPYDQEDISWRGSAIECRIYAEDPLNDFTPSLGTVRHLRNPEGPWVRVETHLYPGYEIPVYYDPLIAKLITWGVDRPSAITRMSRALEEYTIEGIETTIPFHIWVMRDPKFSEGDFDTSYIDSHYTGSARNGRHRIPDEVAIIAASLSSLATTNLAYVRSTPSSRWRQIARRESANRWTK